MWSPGDQVLLREIWNGRVWTARPMTVVRDSPALLALYIAPGTRWKKPITPQGEWARMAIGDWRLADDVWTGQGSLRLTTPGDGHSVLLFWGESGDGWERWTPDPSWPVPELPAEWDVV